MHEPELLGVLEALAFSAERHRHQKRKGRLASPYINHPIDVALIIVREGGVSTAPVLTAALLHDTIEDTTATRAEIDQMFGKDIGALVDGLTKLKKLDLAMKQADAMTVSVTSMAKTGNRSCQLGRASGTSNSSGIIDR